MPHELAVELSEDPCSRLMSRDISNPGMQSGIEVRVRREGTRGHGFAHAVAERAQLGYLGLRDALGGTGRDKAFHLASDVGDLDGLLDRDLANPSPAIGLDLDQAVRFELKEGVADDEPARVELLREFRFDEPLPHAVLAAEDSLAKSLTHIRRIAHGGHPFGLTRRAYRT